MNIYRAASLIYALATFLAVPIILPTATAADDPFAEARNLNNQATTLYQQKRYAEAEQVERRAVALFEKAGGPDSPDLAKSLSNLGELLRAQKRLGEAEPLFRRSLAIKEKAFGPDHLEVAGALNDLAINYRAQGRFAEAEPLYMRALAISEKVGGSTHPNVAFTLNKLADLYRAEGRNAKADAMSNRIKVIQQPVPTPLPPLPASEVTAFFARELPGIRSRLQAAPAIEVARSYLNEVYSVKGFQTFVPRGARMITMLFGKPHSVTKENFESYVKGYSDVLAIIGEVIEQRRSRQLRGDNFMMTVVGPGCQQEGFRDGAVSTTQSDYKIRLENGWPKKFEGVIVGDTIGIGVPGNDLPDMIGSGRVEGDRVNLTFPDCKVTLMPH